MFRRSSYHFENEIRLTGVGYAKDHVKIASRIVTVGEAQIGRCVS